MEDLIPVGAVLVVALALCVAALVAHRLRVTQVARERCREAKDFARAQPDVAYPGAGREGVLELHEEFVVPAYALAGRRVRPGDALESAGFDGWVGGTFAWSGSPENLPRLVVETGGEDGPLEVVLRPSVRCRWPAVEPPG